MFYYYYEQYKRPWSDTSRIYCDVSSLDLPYLWHKNACQNISTRMKSETKNNSSFLWARNSLTRKILHKQDQHWGRGISLVDDIENIPRFTEFHPSHGRHLWPHFNCPVRIESSIRRVSRKFKSPSSLYSHVAEMTWSISLSSRRCQLNKQRLSISSVVGSACTLPGLTF